MSDFVVRAEKLGKKYRLGHHGGPGAQKYTALRDVLMESVKAPFRAFLPGKLAVQPNDRISPGSEDFWALKEVAFEIQQGDSVGIIGRNGAGKSTLLKILSRITEPTTGRVEIEGRVSSLLEVGTGFHQELTGRENIYLNGTILGMKRSEIKKKFDEIVAFAEVEKFLDTPVKHFSSGMYVRLAFAVAAHLDSEILIVDEVLAVGDLQFQKKCLGKMQDITGAGGRTVLFVSHNMDLISKLCNRALMLTAGKSGHLDLVEKVISEYITQTNEISGTFVAANPKRSLREVTLDRKALLNEQLTIKIKFFFSSKVVNPTFGVVIYTEGGSPIFGSNNMYHPMATKAVDISSGEAEVTFKQLPLWPGRYMVSVWLSDGLSPIDHQESAISFEFASSTTPLNAPPSKYIGPIHLPARWKIVS